MTTEHSDSADIEVLPPAVRQRLQQCHEFGLKRTAAGEWDYATELLQQCVAGDPTNLTYVQSYITNLQKKYNNNKKGSKLAAFSGTGSKRALKKKLAEQDWLGALRDGFEALKPNPWDFTTLNGMAEACEQLALDDMELALLKHAREGSPKDPAVNKACANALARRGRYDEAIKCWHQVELAKPHNPEALKAIGDLQTEKMQRRHGPIPGQERKSTGKKPTGAARKGATLAPATKPTASANKQPAQAKPAEEERVHIELSPEQILRRQISLNPENLANYVQLAEHFAGKNDFDKAEEVLNKANAISAGDVTVREPLEDLQIRRARHKLAVAERRAKEAGSDITPETIKKLKFEYHTLEVETFRERLKRYPHSLQLKYELGARLKRAGNYKEAMPLLQEALEEGPIKGLVYLELAECFYHLKQYKEAIEHYELAAEGLWEQQVDQRKSALYGAGVLASGLKDYDKAEKHLTALTELDAGYKDAAARLDKVAQLRNKG